MRKTFLRIWSGWYLEGLAVLLSGAACNLSQASVLPRCEDGQALSSDAQGNFVCQDAPPSLLEQTMPPSGCSPGQALAYDQVAHQLYCVNLSQSDPSQRDAQSLRLQIESLAKRVQSLQATLGQLRAQAGFSEPFYLGSTAAVTTGRITLNAHSGLFAAAGLCAAEFGPGARMCTPLQLTRSVALGKLGPTEVIAPAWVYMPTWHNPKNSIMEPLSGLADNCGGYTTELDHYGWTGMAVEWGPLASGDVAFRWHGGDDAPCSQSLPIACCGGGSP